MNFRNRLWDVKAAVATIVESEPVGWKDETLIRVPIVNGEPRVDLRSKRRGFIERRIYQEALINPDITTPPTIEFLGLKVKRRVLTRREG